MGSFADRRHIHGTPDNLVNSPSYDEEERIRHGFRPIHVALAITFFCWVFIQHTSDLAKITNKIT